MKIFGTKFARKQKSKEIGTSKNELLANKNNKRLDFVTTFHSHEEFKQIYVGEMRGGRWLIMWDDKLGCFLATNHDDEPLPGLDNSELFD